MPVAADHSVFVYVFEGSLSVGAAALTHDLPLAFGFTVRNELRWGRIWTVAISLVATVERVTKPKSQLVSRNTTSR